MTPIPKGQLERALYSVIGRPDPTMIRVWAFRDAPQELRILSRHGGDEDWIAVIGPKASDKDPLWADSGTPFGCYDVERHMLPEGYIALIGAHA